jgi:hypothetical protein
MDRDKGKAPAREPFLSRSLWFAAIAVLAGVYLLQAATPLRLDDDSVDYLRAAAAITDGNPLPTLPVPLGYSYVLSFLERAGVAVSAGFVLVNCLFLGIALHSVWHLRDYPERSRQLAVVMTLLAVPVVRSVPIALPDAAFLAASLLAVWAMSSATDESGLRRFLLLGCAIASSVIAISFRSIGVALGPPLIWTVVQRPTHDSDRAAESKRRLIKFLIFVLAAAAAAVLVASSRVLTRYLSETMSYYVDGPLLSRVAMRAAVVLRSWGEIVLNIPFSRLRNFGGVLAALGALSAAVFLALVRWPIHWTAPRIYLVTSLIVLIAWPNPAPRLWMPIIPLVVAEVSTALPSIDRPAWLPTAAASYVVWVAMTGIAALAYTTRISLSGDRFPQLYGKSGGMADPDIHEGNKSWSRVQFYRVEAARMLARYGR